MVDVVSFAEARQKKQNKEFSGQGLSILNQVKEAYLCRVQAEVVLLGIRHLQENLLNKEDISMLDIDFALTTEGKSNFIFLCKDTSCQPEDDVYLKPFMLFEQTFEMPYDYNPLPDETLSEMSEDYLVWIGDQAARHGKQIHPFAAAVTFFVMACYQLGLRPVAHGIADNGELKYVIFMQNNDMIHRFVVDYEVLLGLSREVQPPAA